MRMGTQISKQWSKHAILSDFFTRCFCGVILCMKYLATFDNVKKFELYLVKRYVIYLCNLMSSCKMI